MITIAKKIYSFSIYYRTQAKKEYLSRICGRFQIFYFNRVVSYCYWVKVVRIFNIPSFTWYFAYFPMWSKSLRASIGWMSKCHLDSFHAYVTTHSNTNSVACWVQAIWTKLRNIWDKSSFYYWAASIYILIEETATVRKLILSNHNADKNNP